jgi:hypothetical protein
MLPNVAACCLCAHLCDRVAGAVHDEVLLVEVGLALHLRASVCAGEAGRFQGKVRAQGTVRKYLVVLLEVRAGGRTTPSSLTTHSTRFRSPI